MYPEKEVLKKLRQELSRKQAIENRQMTEKEYKRREYRCETEVTDEDMLRLLIDQALKDGDEERFLELSRQLNHHIAERDE